MKTYSPSVIQAFANNEALGAGNFFFKLLESGIDQERLALQLDEAVTLPDASSTDTLSLSQIKLWAQSWAAWYENQGVKPKDPVALYLDDNVEYLVHFIALTCIGAIPVAINGALKYSIVSQFLERVGAVLIMSSEEKLKKLKPFLVSQDYDIRQVSSGDISLTPAQPSRLYQHQADDPILLGHTSGTTGIPKAVQFNHHGFSFGVKQQLTKQLGSKVLSALPHSHASDLSILMSSLLRGAVVKIQSSKEPESLFSAIKQFQPDLFVSFPKVYVDLCRYELDDYDLSSVSYWLSTGDANHEPHIKQLIQHGSHCYKGELREGSIFIDNLGSSEFGYAAFRNIHRNGSKNYQRCIGKPMEWVDVAILDETGSELGTNEVGYLGVKSESVTPGYWNNSLMSERNRLAGFWLTGDLAYVDDRGMYYHVDRVSDKVQTEQGVLFTCEVEELVLKHIPEIFECSVVGIEGEGEYQIPVILVEPKVQIDCHKMLEKINTLLAENNKPRISKVLLEASQQNIGVTGKKLKRQLRDVLSEA